MIKRVELSKRALKDLRSIPAHIAGKLATWIEDVEEQGLEEVRKIPGLHDEPLKGGRQGQRSIRLSKTYRAIYIVLVGGTIEFVMIIEVNKHEY